MTTVMSLNTPATQTTVKNSSNKVQQQLVINTTTIRGGWDFN